MRKSNSNSTKVICSNCGAEVIIPNHEHCVCGVAIGKDSGLGTIALPTKGGASALGRLRDLVKDNAAMSQLVEEVVSTIYNAGYIDVDNVVRRWIPAQCLAMEYGRVGFQNALIMRGYEYSWRVLLNDLKRQAQLAYKHDDEGVVDRQRWYNKEVALDMANHFIDELSEEMNRMPQHLHGSRKYIKLKCFLNDGKGVHADEFQKVFTPLAKAVKKIKSCVAPKTVYEAVAEFDKLRRSIKFCPTNPSKSFINAFKAAGAYYTMKDLIQFEDCNMKLDKDGISENHEHYYGGKPRKFVGKEKSLEALERKAADLVKRGVAECGYEMLGLLRDFLSYNNFDYNSVSEKWRDQSEARRAVRRAMKNRRPRK